MLLSMASTRPLAFVSAVIGFGGSIAYVAIIVGEGNHPVGAWIGFALVMMAASALAVFGAFVARPSAARGVLMAATIIFAIVGFLGLFTIGIIFIIAAAFSGAALARIRTPAE